MKFYHSRTHLLVRFCDNSSCSKKTRLREGIPSLLHKLSNNACKSAIHDIWIDVQLFLPASLLHTSIVYKKSCVLSTPDTFIKCYIFGSIWQMSNISYRKHAPFHKGRGTIPFEQMQKKRHRTRLYFVTWLLMAGTFLGTRHAQL